MSEVGFMHEEEEDDDDIEMDVADSDDDDEAEDDMNEEAANSAPEPVEEDAAIARRRAIQNIMRDTSLSEQEKRMRIQGLMSGNRLEVAPPPAPVIAAPEANAACVHYERNCNIVAPCCKRIFGCRICHDELTESGHPPMNRFLIREVVCKNCNTQQQASNQCINCQTVFGEYHCSICNLWMSMVRVMAVLRMLQIIGFRICANLMRALLRFATFFADVLTDSVSINQLQAKKPFHCDQCGFCRVGGVESFRHCNECCMCIAVTVFETHQCFKDKYKNNCPVCREDMFSSRQSPQDLPCGHAIHAHCFRKLAGFDYRCPICKKTVVSQQSMAAAWEARARDIAEHPMPADLQRIVDIMCNDCESKSTHRQWHFLGIQCPRCSSFNTVVEQVLSSGASAPGAPDQPANASA